MNPLPCGSKGGNWYLPVEETALYEDTVELAGGEIQIQCREWKGNRDQGPYIGRPSLFRKFGNGGIKKNEADDN